MTKGPNLPLQFPSNFVADELWLKNCNAAASVDQHLQVSGDSTAAALRPCGELAAISSMFDITVVTFSAARN